MFNYARSISNPQWENRIYLDKDQHDQHRCHPARQSRNPSRDLPRRVQHLCQTEAKDALHELSAAVKEVLTAKQPPGMSLNQTTTMARLVRAFQNFIRAATPIPKTEGDAATLPTTTYMKTSCKLMTCHSIPWPRLQILKCVFLYTPSKLFFTARFIKGLWEPTPTYITLDP